MAEVQYAGERIEGAVEIYRSGPGLECTVEFSDAELLELLEYLEPHV